MKRIVHIITGLGSGGAEHMLYKLLKYSDNERYYHEVISLMDEGVYGSKIEGLGIKLHCLNLNSSNIISSILRSRKIAKNFDIVDTWLYHADILGFIIAKILLRKKLIWNVRHSNLDKDANKSTTLKIVKINSILSKYVNLITYNSNKALENHIKFGYVDKNSEIIPNGFELDKFNFSLEDRLRVRQELGLKEDGKPIITVGRWDIQKDYYTLLRALNELNNHNTKFKMIMVGSDLDYSNVELVELIDKYNLKDNMILLGRRDDVPALLSAADIYVSSSLGESFSNAIGEAMACEMPCVVTDVGDSKLMVGDTGKVVQAGDYMEMSKELFYYINNTVLERNIDARNRVIENYGIEKITKLFEDIWCDLVY
ncbi:glycosyltransferase [Tissierella pigra]|uniref:Glycosyltransferase n=1 Tax=Tissierella pigra TaxID=2607614 RepID=A0A6N7XWE4_9FIRM|nr:glycosyltransferase [Tissierella pigra]MSU02127.1 glycosyltransferase [Tissierella pigra]